MAESRRRDIEIAHDESDDRTHDELQEAVEECLNCHAVCTLTLQHCIASGGDNTEVNLVGVLLDCAELCQTSANFMLRGKRRAAFESAMTTAPNAVRRAWES